MPAVRWAVKSKARIAVFELLHLPREGTSGLATLVFTGRYAHCDG